MNVSCRGPAPADLSPVGLVLPRVVVVATRWAGPEGRAGLVACTLLEAMTGCGTDWACPAVTARRPPRAASRDVKGIGNPPDPS